MHGSTFVFPGSYSLVIDITAYNQFGVLLFENITNAMTEGFKHLLSARDGSVFSVALDFQTRPVQHSSQIIMEGSSLMIALNATEPSSYIGWYEQTIAAFHSKAPPAIRNLNLLSPQTFQARFNSPIRLCVILSSFGLTKYSIASYYLHSDACFT